MQVDQATINGMLKNISDPRLRATYGDILSGKHAYKVYCINPQINPATKKPYHANPCLIGFIQASGQVIDAQTVNKDQEPIAGIETSRDRFDGRKGFRCYCGNWSIQSPEEQGVLEKTPAPLPPTRQQLNDIFTHIQKSNKGPLQFINGVAEYDGFRIEEVQE